MLFILSDRILIKPAHPLAVLPLTLAWLILGIHVRADPMLLAISPLAFIPPSIWPSEAALSMLLVLVIATLVNSAVVPLHLPLAVHVVPMPFPDIHSPIAPFVDAAPMNVVLIELTLIHGALGPEELATPVFLAAPVVSCKLGAVCPYLDTVPLLHVLMPLPVVARPILVDKFAVTLRTIFIPLALIRVAVYVRELPSPVRLVLGKLAFVPTTVGPLENALALSHAT
mmetsp:Transcript_120380/g.225016  ORF Transcript_120380/g.225016 Transcript_120380/m.225016 type:complete len:227 (-) Transcript_120380:452-1132(-)